VLATRQETPASAGKRPPLIKEAEKLEARLAALQGELKLLEARLADPALYAAPDKALLADLTSRQTQLAQDISQTETRWLEVQEALSRDGFKESTT
jgi:ATP-binding cassette subfamily F protein 3